MCNKCKCNAVTYERKDPAERKREILDAAVELAQDQGYQNLTHSRIAGAVKVSPSLIRKYYVDKSQLRDAVMSEAVRLEIAEIVLQGLAAKDPIAHDAPAWLKVAALGSCA